MHKTTKKAVWTASLCMAESMKTDIKKKEKENEHDKYRLKSLFDSLPHSASFQNIETDRFSPSKPTIP